MSRKTFDALYEKHAKDTETKPSSSNKSLLSSIGDHFDDRANQVNQEYNLGSPADDLTPEEDYIDAFGKAAVTDMATSVGEWAKNAPKNYAGAWKARNKVLEEHPLAAIDEDVLDTSNAPAPTKEQLQTVTDYEEAMSKLNDETVRPAVTVAAVLGVPGGTFAYMPYMAKDILDTYGREVEEKGFKEGMISGTLTNAKEITIGNMWYYLTDKEFNERIKEDPSLLKDVLLEAADVGAGVRTAVHPMVRRVSNKVKLKAEQSKLIKDIVKEIKEGISDESSRQQTVRSNKRDVRRSNAKNRLAGERTQLPQERNPQTDKNKQSDRVPDNTTSADNRSDINYLRKASDGSKTSTGASGHGDVAAPDIHMQLDKLSEVERQAYLEDTKRSLEEAIVEEPLIRTTTGRDITTLAPDVFKAVTQHEIVKFINDNFTTMRYGNFEKGVPKRAAGYFRNTLQTIRLRKYGKFGDALHEVGHYLDSQLRIDGADAELISNAREVFNGSNYKESEMRSEGIAEFTREYLLNPDEAAKNFPDYYRAFTAEIARIPKYQQSLDTLSNMMRSYSQLNPAQATRAAMSFDRDRKKSLGEKFLNFYDRAIFEAFDDKIHIQRAEQLIEAKLGRKLKPSESPYVRARLLDGFVDGQSSLMLEGDAAIDIDVLNKYFFDNKLKNKVTFNDILSPLADEATLNTKYPTLLKDFNVKNWAEALSVYLVANHNYEVGLVKGAERVAEAQLVYDKLVEESKARLKGASGNPIASSTIGKQEAAKLEAAAKRLVDLKKNPYDTAVSMANAKRVLEMEVPPEIKAAAKLYYAYTDNILGILEAGQLISAETRTTLREKYPCYCPFQRDFSLEGTKGFESNTGLLDMDSGLSYLSEGGSNLVIIDPLTITNVATKGAISRMHKNKLLLSLRDTAKEAGFGAICEPVGHKAAKTSSFNIYENGEAKAYQTLPEVYDALKTFDAKFMKDILGLLGTTLATANKTIRLTATNNPAFIATNGARDTMTAGAQSNNGFVPFASTAASLKHLTDKHFMSLYRASGVQYSTLRGSSLHDASMRIEDQLKPKGTLKKKLHKGWQTYNKLGDIVEGIPRMYEYGATLQKTGDVFGAAIDAKEITIDFSKGGRSSKFINRYAIPFFNAGMLGISKIGNMFSSREKFLRFLTKGTLYLSSLSVLSWQLNHDEDWYQELSTDQRARFWYWGQLPDGTLIKQPKPLGINHVFCTPTEALLEQALGSGNTRLSTESTLRNALDSLSPTGSLGLESGVAGLVKPAVEHAANHSFFRNAPIVPARLQNRPPEEQYTVYTPEIYKLLGEQMEWSPLVIENYVNGLLTSAGAFAAGSLDGIIKSNTAPAKHWNEAPVVGRFFESPNKWTKSVDYYFETVKYFEAEKNSKDVTRQRKATSALNNTKKARKEISAMYKDRRNIAESTKLSAEEKRSKMDKLDVKILKKAYEVNQQLHKYLPPNKK
ncbi:LPD38 domain-containing protein [Phascolarctobacterium faecium]|uniref:LPD38 domain-containing protein n=1 Tax=Phascolarctobacterium faecium TaxID=33025 RepID=UPI003AB2CE32